MAEWKECTIKDLGEVVGGATPSTKDPCNYENGSIPWITPKDLSLLNGRFISQGERCITGRGVRPLAMLQYRVARSARIRVSKA